MISENFNRPTLIVIAGPTAVGKTQFCIALAKQYGCSIISADSRQFYREMNIGTAAPTKEEMGNIPHYFVGHLSIKDYYSVSRFEQDVLKLLPTLFQQTNTVIMTGGSGLYLDAVCYGIDELPDPDPAIRRRLFCYTKMKGCRHSRPNFSCWIPNITKVWMLPITKDLSEPLKCAFKPENHTPHFVPCLKKSEILI